MTDITIDPPTSDTTPAPTELRRPTSDLGLLALDVLLDGDKLELRLSGTSERVSSPYLFTTGCSKTVTTRLAFPRGGLGSVTVEKSCYRDHDGDGVVELELESPGNHALEISFEPAATGEQQGLVYPSVPTTNVVLRPDVNCPQPKKVP